MTEEIYFPEQRVVLCRIIKKLLKDKTLTQIEAAKMLGIGQPKISEIYNEKIYSYSIERLLRYINILGYDVEIMIRSSMGKIGCLRIYI